MYNEGVKFVDIEYSFNYYRSETFKQLITSKIKRGGCAIRCEFHIYCRPQIFKSHFLAKSRSEQFPTLVDILSLSIHSLLPIPHPQNLPSNPIGLINA